MKKILVTGGAGFIGSHTVDLLLKEGWRVTVYDNFVTGKLANLNIFHPELRVVQGDVLDYPKLLDEVRHCEAVLHLAALPSVPKSFEDPISTLRINTQGLVHVLQALREVQKPIRLVYASSAAVYGKAVTLPCSDEKPLTDAVLSPYALEKINSEHYAKLYTDLFDIKSLGLRYFNVYGTRQDPKSPYSGVISKFIENYKKSKPMVIFGDGEQSRDFIYVADVARANLLALKNDYAGILNIATGTPETLNNLARYIGSVGGAQPKIQLAAPRVGDIPESYATIEKAKQCLKFQSETSLRDGVRLVMGGVE